MLLIIIQGNTLLRTQVKADLLDLETHIQNPQVKNRGVSSSNKIKKPEAIYLNIYFTSNTPLAYNLGPAPFPLPLSALQMHHQSAMLARTRTTIKFFSLFMSHQVQKIINLQLVYWSLYNHLLLLFLNLSTNQSQRFYNKTFSFYPSVSHNSNTHTDSFWKNKGR